MAALCRFCGSAEIISLSAWPEWATRLVGVEMAARFGLRPVESVKARILSALPKGLRDDFIAARRIRVACKRCHHGWMSRLDALVRPLLVPLITGKEVVLMPADQRALAAWVAKTVMISEFASSDGVVTLRTERETLRQTLEAPASWNIWIARNSGRLWAARFVRHAATLGPGGKSADTQSVTIGMGRILVHVMASTVSGMKFELPGNSEPFHMLWPVRKAITWPPRGALDHDAVENFSTGFNRDFGIPEIEHIGTFPQA